MLRLYPDDIKTLTLVASRKAMLSENSDADRASMANINSRRKHKGWPQPEAEKNSRPCFTSLFPAISGGP
jgi:hypothetical protein